MLTTIEAEIDVSGKVTLLEPIKITKKSRVILTLLDDDKFHIAKNYEPTEVAEARFANWIGSVDSGNPNSADNEQIDKDLALEYGATENDDK
jgi:hypothetical protein